MVVLQVPAEARPWVEKLLLALTEGLPLCSEEEVEVLVSGFDLDETDLRLIDGLAVAHGQRPVDECAPEFLTWNAARSMLGSRPYQPPTRLGEPAEAFADIRRLKWPPDEEFAQ